MAHWEKGRSLYVDMDFWYWHGPRILGHLSIHLTTTASFLFLKILAWFYGVNLGRTKFLSSFLGGLVSYINLPVKLLASITKLADIFCNRLPVLCRDIRLQPGRLQDSISTSDANGPVLFGLVRFSNIQILNRFGALIGLIWIGFGAFTRTGSPVKPDLVV